MKPFFKRTKRDNQGRKIRKTNNPNDYQRKRQTKKSN